MGGRSWKLIASDESPILAKSFYDPIVMEYCESDGCLPDSSCADQSNGLEVFNEFDDLFDELVPSEAVPWCQGR